MLGQSGQSEIAIAIKMAPETISCTCGETPSEVRPVRSRQITRTPAAMPSGRAVPPANEAPPRMTAATAGTVTSESPAGDAADQLKLISAPASAHSIPEDAKT